MIELSIQNLTKYYGANKIFENISLDVKTGERIGFIGQNGCGKTTIMKIIMGEEDLQEGGIHIRKDAKVGYLNQIPVFDELATTMDVLHLAFEKTYVVKKQMKQLEDQFVELEGDTLEKALVNYGKLTDQFELLGGYQVETKINKITDGLLITDNLKEMLFSKLSGGEKTRVILTKLLLEEPDILLLDEPTNHLDLVAIEWLEGFLTEYKGSVLVISHDRYFLDSVVSKIIELEFDHAETYLGNYSFYVIEKERRFLIDYKNYKNQQKKIDQMERQIERYRIWDSEKMYRRAKELEKRLEKIDVLDRPLLEKRKIRLDQHSLNRTGKIVLETRDLSKSFGEKELIKEVNVNIFYQDSACIIGMNGSGKSTLLKLILGEMEPDHGTVKIGSQVKIGYLSQHVLYEDEEQTVLEYFSRLHDITIGAARSQLAKVLFLKEDVNKKIKSLSGGEKSRLKLCSLTFDGVNLMILDEPTNHLDIDSREVLEKTLLEFEGTLLLVSHDRYFINKVADKILAIEQKSIKIYEGDYNYYLEEKQKSIVKYEATANKSTIQKGSSTSNDLTKQIRKLELIELEIEELELMITSIEEEMNLYNSDVLLLKELFNKKEDIVLKLKFAYDNWEINQIS